MRNKTAEMLLGQAATGLGIIDILKAGVWLIMCPDRAEPAPPEASFFCIAPLGQWHAAEAHVQQRKDAGLYFEIVLANAGHSHHRAAGRLWAEYQGICQREGARWSGSDRLGRPPIGFLVE